MSTRFFAWLNFLLIFALLANMIPLPRTAWADEHVPTAPDEVEAPPDTVTSAPVSGSSLPTSDPASPVVTTTLKLEAGTTGTDKDHDVHPATWKFLYTPPTVSLFGGGASYNYPIEIPPGRNGLQPQVNLSYSSRRADGLLGYLNIDAGPLGIGWSADQIDIVRTDFKACLFTTGTCFTDKYFVLSLNGTSHDLVPEESRYRGRFYAKDAPYLYIERRNDCDPKFSFECNSQEMNGSPANETADYWLVKLADGTQVRLGYFDHSEQVMNQVVGSGGYGGTQPGKAVKRWRVDTITDTFGNTISFDYWEFRDKDSNDKWNLLESIQYNRDDLGNYLSRVEFFNDKETDPLQAGPLYTAIQVFDNDQLVRTYSFGTTRHWENGPCGESLNQAFLEGIQLFDGSGEKSLPATTFKYAWLPNWGDECYRYPRLGALENGYGGASEFFYQGDDYWHANEPCPIPGWPYPNCPNLDPEAVGQSYAVTEMRTFDGLNNDTPTVVTYDYGSSCRNVKGDGHICAGPNPQKWATIVGYDSVTNTLYSLDSNVVSIHNHRFHLDYDLLGHEHQVQTRDASSTLLQQTVSSWSTRILTNTTVAYLDAAIASDYSSDPPLDTQVEYLYDDYGNRTRTLDYLDGNLYRFTLQQFIPNTDAWIVDKPAWSAVFDPDWTALSANLYYYDDRDYTQGPGSQGRLSLTRAFTGTAEQPMTNREVGTVDTRLAYDDYGNLVSTTVYQGYGQSQCVTPPGGGLCQWNSARIGGGTAYTTTVVYDPLYHLYPVTTTNPLGHTSQTEYYGINEHGAPADGGLLGQVWRVWDANGQATATRYTYDLFGRLTHVWRAGESLEDPPSQLFTYSDANHETNPQWQPLLVNTWHKTDPDVTWNDFWLGAGCVWERQFYDGLGRLIQTQSAAPDWTPGGGSSQHDIVQYTLYDAVGRTSKQSVAYPVPRFADYGHPYRDPDLGKPSTENQYDALGRVTLTLGPDGTRTIRHYGVIDGLKYEDVVDANRHRKQYHYDIFGRLVGVHEMTGNCGSYWADEGLGCQEPYTTPWSIYAETSYAYDRLDNLSSVTDDTGNNVTEMFYDALGRKTGMSDPDMGVWNYQYAPSGNLIRQQDARGNVLCLYYDELNRLSAKSSGETTCPVTPPAPGQAGHLEVRTYDQGLNGIGRLTRAEDLSGYRTWTYDQRGRTLQETRYITEGGSFDMSYTYDSLDRPVVITYPNGEVVTSSYNLQGLAESLVGDDPYVQQATYNTMGQLKSLALGNDLSTWYGYYGYEADGLSDAYDAKEFSWWPSWGSRLFFGRLYRTCTAPDGSAADCQAPGQPVSPPLEDQLMDLSYWYDAAGNLLTINDLSNDAQAQHFTYDDIDRLTAAYATQGQGQYTRAYAYDQIGNMTAYDSFDYFYQGSGHEHSQPHAVTAVLQGSMPVAEYAYDANGNMTWREEQTGAFTQTYDIENRLVEVVDADTGESTQFLYDAGGQRVKVVKPDGTSVLYPFPVYEEEIPSDADSIYVDANYAGPEDGSRERPFNTIDEAVEVVCQGCTIRIGQGTYPESLAITSTADVQVIGGYRYDATAGQVDWDTNDPWQYPTILTDVVRCDYPGHGSSSAVCVKDAPDTLVQGLSLRHDGATNFWTGLSIYRSEGSLVREVRAEGYSTGMNVESSCTVENNLLVDNNYGAKFISCHTPVRAFFVNNTVVGNASRGISSGYLAGSDLAFEIRDNIVVSNGTGIYIYEPTQVTVTASYNDVWGNNTNYVGITPGEGSISADPLFVDAANDDYRLYENSPAVGAASDGEQMGAFEEVVPLARGSAPAPKGNAGLEAVIESRVIRRLTYSFNGKTVAVRVTGDPDPDDNGLFFLHADHLNSNSLMSDASGSPRSGSLTRYLPYGGYRVEPDIDLTDRGFTGHRHNDDIGLIFMNARYYLPGLGRFASADTVVPNPGDPQDWNRYTYVRNNPLAFIDPSGHFLCMTGGQECVDWIEAGLGILGQYGGAEGRDLVNLFNKLDGLFDVGVWVFFLPDITDQGIAGMAPPTGLTDYNVHVLLLNDDFLSFDLTLHANWDGAATLGHEIVHLGQSASERLSLQGEAKAYQAEGRVRSALGLGQTMYTAGVAGFDLSTQEGILQATANLRSVPGSIYTWQPRLPIEQEASSHIGQFFEAQVNRLMTSYERYLGNPSDNLRRTVNSAAVDVAEWVWDHSLPGILLNNW